MQCGACGNETNDQLKYCEYCGVDLVFDEVEYSGTVRSKNVARAKLSFAQRVRGALLASAFVLFTVVAVRFVVLSRPIVEVQPVYMLSPSLPGEHTPEKGANTVTVEALNMSFPE